MAIPAPVPSASWTLRRAADHARGAHEALLRADADHWQGTAAVTYRNRLSGMRWATTALIGELEEAERAARHHERELDALRGQWEDVR